MPVNEGEALIVELEAAAPPRSKGTFGLYALIVCAIAGLVVFFEIRNPAEVLAAIAAGRTRLHELVATSSLWGPVLFVLAYAALMVLIWVPSWPCSMMGGFLFGTAWGAAYSLVGSTLGAVVAFMLARSGLAHRISRRHALVRRLDAGFQRDALEYVVALRLLPVMPFGIIHVAAAIFGVPLRIFALGTALGMIPCIIIYATLGADLDRIMADGKRVDAATLTDIRVLGPLFALAALALVPIAIRRFREWRGRK